MLWIRFTSLSLVTSSDFVNLFLLSNGLDNVVLPREGVQIVLIDGERRVQFISRDANSVLFTETALLPIQFEQWYNIALTRHSTNSVSIYIDGVLSAVHIHEYGQRVTPSIFSLVNDTSVNAAFDLGVLKIWDKSIGKKDIVTEMNTVRAQDRNDLNSLYFLNSTGLGP